MTGVPEPWVKFCEGFAAHRKQVTASYGTQPVPSRHHLGRYARSVGLVPGNVPRSSRYSCVPTDFGSIGPELNGYFPRVLAGRDDVPLVYDFNQHALFLPVVLVRMIQAVARLPNRPWDMTDELEVDLMMTKVHRLTPHVEEFLDVRDLGGELAMADAVSAMWAGVYR